MILVELGERTFEGELAARDLQALGEIAGAHEQHAPSVLDEREGDGCGEMALAAAGRASAMMPGVWDLRCRSSTRFIRDAVTRWAFSAASCMAARSISSSDSRTAH
jgi:hypothetical protein